MILCNLEWVKRIVFGFIAETILNFSDAGEDSSSVRLELLALSTESELDSEPVDSSETNYLSLGGSQTSKSDFLTEVCEILVREHRSVTEQLVDHIRLRGVQRHC